MAAEATEGSIDPVSRPVVGVIGNAFLVDNRFSVQLVGDQNMRAVADIAEAFPLMFAGSPSLTPIPDLLEIVDGVLLTGGKANVHPARYNVEPHPKYEPYDEDRDAITLPLSKRVSPVVCRYSTSAEASKR